MGQIKIFLENQNQDLTTDCTIGMIGKEEIYGKELVQASIVLIKRYRKIKKMIYTYSCGDTVVYLRREDLPESKLNLFKYNPKNGLYEFKN